jgi:hypothetical protein
VPSLAPEQAWDVLYGSVASVGFGDIATEQVWWRYALAGDLATNGRAYAGATQSVYIDFFNNDTVPRRVEDFADPQAYVLRQGFETLLTPTAIALDAQMRRDGVEHTFELHPGLHSMPYWAPYLRGYVEALHGNLGRPAPTEFDYRTIRTDFRVWGWHVVVDREPVEFLDLLDVTCERLTLRGTGTVLVEPPASCGRAPVTVDLGPSHPTDEPAGAGAVPAYGTTRTVELPPA